MVKVQVPRIAVFSVGMIGLGVLALVYGDFALVGQPVPTWFPFRTGLAYASGIVMLFGGLGLFFETTSNWCVRVLFPYLIAWLLLKVPTLFLTPQREIVWLGAGELVVLLTGAWVLFAEKAEVPEGSLLNFLTTGARHGGSQDFICNFATPDRTFAFCLCKGHRGPSAGMASVPYRLGVSNRCRPHCRRYRSSPVDIPASGCHCRSRNVEHIYAARLDACDMACTANTIAMDRILCFLGNHIQRMAGRMQHDIEQIRDSGCMSLCRSRL